MLRYVTIIDSGQTIMLQGDVVDRGIFEEENRKAIKEGKKPASAMPELKGITKASLATSSWLSAASFQETTRVLTEAALTEVKDDLVGLKENVIVGNLIPAGTGLSLYRRNDALPTDEAKERIYPSEGTDSIKDVANAFDEKIYNLEEIDLDD
jgi:DNA-directed RNA polymerase subunit beta'